MPEAGLKSCRSRSMRKTAAPNARAAVGLARTTHSTSSTSIENIGRKSTLTRALRSHQLWLTVAYLGILTLMARGFAS